VAPFYPSVYEFLKRAEACQRHGENLIRSGSGCCSVGREVPQILHALSDLLSLGGIEFLPSPADAPFRSGGRQIRI
jgi:hypothetical protein